MGRYVMWITFMVTLQFSAVLCRNPFHEYFYNKYHHKGHSTTAFISASTSDISSEDIPVSDDTSLEDLLHSSTEGTSLKNLLHTSTVEHGITVDGNMTILRYGDTYRDDPGLAPGVIAAIIVFCLSIGLLCCCCCSYTWCRKKKEGIVLSNNQSETTRVLPEGNLLNYAHFPNFNQEPAQQYPTHYQPQPVQQYPTYYQSQPLQQPPYLSPVHSLYQHNEPSLMQPYNIPDTPPPPYEAPPYEDQVASKQ